MKKVFLVLVSILLMLSVAATSLSEEVGNTGKEISHDDSSCETAKEECGFESLPVPLNYAAQYYDYVMTQIDHVEDKEACLKAVMTALYVINTLQLFGTDEITLKEIYECLKSVSVDCKYYDIKGEVLIISDYLTIYAEDPLGDNSIRVQGDGGYVLYFDFATGILTNIRVDIPVR